MTTTSYIKKYRETGDKSYLKQYYSADSYHKIYDTAKLKKAKWVQKFEVIQNTMRLKSGEKVLDIGCAGKMFKSFVEEKDAIYTSVDIAEHFQPDYVADAESLEGVPEDGFDWVLLSDVLEHLPDPMAALQSAHRAGKRIFSVVPNWYRLECIPGLPRDQNDRHLNRMRPSLWLELHKKAGWKVTHIRGFYYVPSIAFYPLWPLQLFDGVMKKSFFNSLSRVVDHRWAHRPFVRVCGQELMIVGERKG